MKSFFDIALVAVLVGFGTGALADIKPPGELNCTVTKLTPENANFFSWSHPAVTVGDTTKLDFLATELAGIDFASGAHIGSTIVPHPLVKAEAWEGVSVYNSQFISTHNHNEYIAKLIAQDYEEGKPILATLDVVERPGLGRMTMHSLELSCVR